VRQEERHDGGDETDEEGVQEDPARPAHDAVEVVDEAPGLGTGGVNAG